eukprot:Skav207553  [mRNA]  locus=scaffold3647:16687:31925:- [translate_table: standard]
MSELVGAAEVDALQPDAFILRSSSNVSGRVLVASVRAVGYAFFEFLQRSGFAFLHPLKPVAWRLPAVDYLDWMLAQKQNYVEWMLLADRRRSKAAAQLAIRMRRGAKEPSFELSDERRGRLQLLVAQAHAKGLEAVGADVPLSLKQQHALNLLPNARSDREKEANSAQAYAAWRRGSTLLEAFEHLLRFMGPAKLGSEQRDVEKPRGVGNTGVQTIPAPGTGPGSATGIAYLQGSEGLSDFASMAARYLGEATAASRGVAVVPVPRGFRWTSMGRFWG